VLIALVVSALVRAFLFQAFSIPSASMEDTLVENDRILVSKIGTKLSPLRRGDIVVFVRPGDWVLADSARSGTPGTLTTMLSWLGVVPSDSEQHLVKRVIGVPGDRVVCCDQRGRITINMAPLDDDFTKPGGRSDTVAFDVMVPVGRYFVMGDNREGSVDSRSQLGVASGTVAAELMVGRVVAVVWPLSRVQAVAPPSAFETIPVAP
jgi:signal peptidase I